MNHFYQSIEGWVDGIDILYYSIIQATKNIKHPLHFVEVGSWKGKSAAAMAVEIINSGKNIQFDCVDTWMGSPEHSDDINVRNNNLYDTFIANMKPVENYYRPIRLTSVDAAKLYHDKSLDFVFIDADHSYEAVKEDINVWLPKLKLGGILAGHDFNPATLHGGVERAVTEAFGNNTIIIPYCWMYYKN